MAGALRARAPVALVTVVVLCCAVAATAHVKNEETQFPDLEYSDARIEILLLSALGIIPETPVFEPEAPLTRTALGSWVALARGLAEPSETPDVDALAAASLEAGLIASRDGEATWRDLSDAFLDGAPALETPDATPSKEAAARFLVEHLGAGRDGLAMASDVEPGPRGVVAEVQTEKQPDGGSAYFVTIGQTTHPAYTHARVANGPTDLLAWEGRTVVRSYTRRIGDRTFWLFLEAEPLAAAAVTAQATPGTAPAAEPEGTGGLWAALVAGVVVLGGLLFLRRRRTF